MSCEETHFLDQLFGAQYSATQHTALSIDKFRGGMRYEVCTPLRGSLQIRRSETVVDVENELMFLRQLTQPLEVYKVKRGVRGRFNEDHLCVRLYLRFPDS